LGTTVANRSCQEITIRANYIRGMSAIIQFRMSPLPLFKKLKLKYTKL